jgi:TolB protein
MRNDGAEVRQVSTAAGSGFAFHAPTWRPTGDLIAFYAGNDGAHDVYVVRPDGSGERDVSNDDPRRGARPTDEYWPSWAPDGSRLAFTRNIVRDQTRAFADVVIVADADGSHATTLDPTRFLHLDPDSRLDRAQPIWSPDAAAIAGYLFNDSDGDDELITYDARDGHVLTRISTHGAGGLLSWQRLEP